MRRKHDETSPRTYHYMIRLAGHKIPIIALLIAFGFTLYLTALNEGIILQNTGGNKESLTKSLILQSVGISAIVGGIVWIVLVLIARRSI